MPEEEQHADGEDRPVLERALRRVAQADLHDVGGHRLDRHAADSHVRRGCWPAAIATIIVSPIARDTARMNAAVMPENAAGTHDAEARLHLRRAERVRALAQAARHALHRVLGQRRDERQDHDAHHDAGAERVEAGQARDEALQERRDEQQREVAVDDRRHAGQDLEHRLDDAAHVARRRTR